MDRKCIIWKYTLKRQKALNALESPVTLSRPEAIAEFLRDIGLQEEEQENMVSILFDTRNNIRGYHTVSIGMMDHSFAHPRETFRFAILQGAVKIALGHNHPSGKPDPSSCDLELTKKIKDAGVIVGIELLDHVIIGENTYFSFLENRLI